MTSLLITGPPLTAEGGVANFYSAVLPHLRHVGEIDVEYVPIGGSRRRAGPLYPVFDQIALARAMERLNPTVVLLNSSLNFRCLLRDAVTIQQAQARGAKVIVFFRGWNDAFANRVDRHWKRLFGRTYERADGLIVLSSGFKSSLERWGITRPIQLATTTVATELMHGFSLSENLRVLRRDHAVRVLFLARVTREKGVFEALEAVLALQKEWPQLTLTVAGAGEALPAVKQFVAKHDPTGQHIAIAGSVGGERKRELFRRHHIYCFPTYTEGMPNSVLEAMAMGMPVVTCPTGGLRDFFQDGLMGYLVAPMSVAEVHRALHTLIADRDKREAMAQYNHHYAVDRFLAPRVAQHLAEICFNSI